MARESRPHIARAFSHCLLVRYERQDAISAQRPLPAAYNPLNDLRYVGGAGGSGMLAVPMAGGT